MVLVECTDNRHTAGPAAFADFRVRGVYAADLVIVVAFPALTSEVWHTAVKISCHVRTRFFEFLIKYFRKVECKAVPCFILW